MSRCQFFPIALQMQSNFYLKNSKLFVGIKEKKKKLSPKSIRRNKRPTIVNPILEKNKAGGLTSSNFKTVKLQ